jgi:UDP:flavonoid glycosyltransferase YjiC (YdhE family)
MQSQDKNPTPNQRPRILFFAEAVTLAHVARPMVLAQALDRSRYDVFFACDPRFLALFGDVPFSVRQIRSMSSKRFLLKTRRIPPLFDIRTLRGYVKEDLEVIEEIRPDLIVGDFRMSLPVSAPIARCPYMAIVNAYWSPLSHWPVPIPDGPALLQWIAKPIVRWVIAWHAWPINRLRREYALQPVRGDFRDMHIWADHVLYPDVPEMIPINRLPANHHYVGPILWSPEMALPDCWNQLLPDRPVVYVALGSSGREELLSVLFKALADLPVSVIVATAGRPLPPDIPANVYSADYLPGREAAARAALVICNGGSPTSHQALAVGTPVLGLASNVDQYMNMEAVCRTGAGAMLRAETTTVQGIRHCVTTILAQPEYGANAARMAKTFGLYDAPGRFRKIVDDLFANDRSRRYGPSKPGASSKILPHKDLK